jgi:hypothetical protein
VSDEKPRTEKMTDSPKRYDGFAIGGHDAGIVVEGRYA